MASVDEGVIRLLKVKVGPRFHEVAPMKMLAIENGVLALEDNWEEVGPNVLERMEYIWDEPFLLAFGMGRAGPFYFAPQVKHLVPNLDWIRDEKKDWCTEL